MIESKAAVAWFRRMTLVCGLLFEPEHGERKCGRLKSCFFNMLTHTTSPGDNRSTEDYTRRVIRPSQF